jgi:hypothetical protein
MAISSQANQEWLEGSTTMVWSPERTVKPRERLTPIIGEDIVSRFVNRSRSMTERMKLLRQIKYGMIIGDGWLYLRKGKRNAYLSIAHCPKQEGYLRWKESRLHEMGFKTKSYFKEAMINNNYPKFVMWTPVDQTWTKHHAEIYSFRNTSTKKKKRITNEILEKIGLVGLAVWYMDDGNTNPERNHAHLGIYDFTIEEASLISDWINRLIGIETRVFYRKKQPFIQFYKGAKKFKDCLKTALLPFWTNDLDCMAYKFISKNDNLNSQETVRGKISPLCESME